MISRGVEISIAEGGGEMVRVLSLGPKGLPYIDIFMTLILMTHHLELHKFYDSSVCHSVRFIR